MQKVLHQLLMDLNKIYTLSPKNSIYPPVINTCAKQTEEELKTEIYKLLKFIKHPELSYLSKK